MDIFQAKKIHFVGISGIGISGLAKICLEMGKEVSGSDLTDSIITEGLRKAGGKILIGKQKESNLPDDADLLVYSNAVPEENAERKKATKKGIQSLNYPQALGQLTRDKKLICVSGTHGKTTTTAMAVSVLKAAGLDASFIVGSYLKEIRGNAAWGQSDYFVLEADEFARAMLNYYPDYLILTNIEADHLDTYKDMEDIKAAFEKYVKNVSRSGVLIANAEDKNIKEVINKSPAKVILYGLKKGKIKPSQLTKGRRGYQFYVNGVKIQLAVPGLHNVYNALAVFALAEALDIKKEVIKKGLENFKGTWRRFEYLGDFNEVTVVSDYAHHPTEIKALLSAAKEVYPNKRIVIAFQPHHHNRTRNLFKEFTRCFDKADLIILNEIFDVAGREGKDDQSVSSKDLVQALLKRKKKAIYSPDLKQTENIIRKEVKKGDVLIIAGAGDIYKVGERLVSI